MNNQQPLQISVVIATCERKARLLSLLRNLNDLSCKPDEVIIVDSGKDRLSVADYSPFTDLSIQCLSSERSVCIQRNKGIRMARSPWILLCDDDVELPVDYLQKLIAHINAHPEAGAVSGVWMEKQDGEWKATHPVRSTKTLLWTYFFQLGIWGEINCKDSIWTKRIKRYYQRKGNHISKAGWPVNTDFSGEYFVCPVYSLGASLVKREWLVQSPFDEVLDPHGIGDNYGVTVDFPTPGVQVITSTSVYHHLEPANRLKRSLQYYRRVLALDYFSKTKNNLHYVKSSRLVWSLFGNMPGLLFSGKWSMLRATFKAISKIILDKNPFYRGYEKGEKIIKPGV